MKIRKDFVSNSSSTSFVFICNDECSARIFADEWKLMLGEWFHNKIDLLKPHIEQDRNTFIQTTCEIVSDEKFIENWWKPRCNFDYYNMFYGEALFIVPESLIKFLSFFDADILTDAKSINEGRNLVITPRFVANKDKIKSFLIDMLSAKYSKMTIGYSNIDNNDLENLSSKHWPDDAIWTVSYDS